MAKSRRTAAGLDMRDLARAGAAARLAALRAEVAALLAAFPGLRTASLGRPAPLAARAGLARRRVARGRRRAMSAAQRKAVGARMRAVLGGTSSREGREPGVERHTSNPRERPEARAREVTRQRSGRRVRSTRCFPRVLEPASVGPSPRS